MKILLGAIKDDFDSQPLDIGKAGKTQVNR